MSGKKYGGHSHSHGDGDCCEQNNTESTNEEGSSDQNNIVAETDIQQMVKLAEQLQRVGFDVSQLESGASKIREAKSKNFAFWSTQPVPQFDEEKPETENTFIEPDLPLDKIRSEPYSMPESFVWSDVDLNDEKQLQELYTLLTENYVEDDDNMFRFDYSAAFLKWYWHRSLNPKKLIDVRFSHLSAKMTIARTIKLYKLPSTPATSGLRPLEKKDISSAWKLLSEYLKRFCLAPVFTKKEFEHVFTPIEDVVYTYVVETGGKVTDMLSFYSLPSSVMHHPTHKSIRAVYSFYNVATTVPFKQLMNDALIFAQKLGFDVFNALDLMENASILEELKFGIGDGNLQYYLYNWRCPEMKPEQIGLVLQ